MANKLTTYRHKRDLARSHEPSGKTAKTNRKHKPIFVIHKHDARNLHYDFRFEVDGVLASWAVPKGPSTDPTVKHLAIPTEDHPLDYAQFEGVIPKGNYGAGTVMVWDIGTFKNIKTKDGKLVPLDECIKRGTIELALEGKKLHGGYALIKTKAPNRSFWLLLKMKDQYANHKIPAATKDRSALSGRTMQAIAKESGDQADADDPDPQPRWISPMLPVLADHTIPSTGWLYERKFDGQRCLAFKKGSTVRLFSRNHLPLNKTYPEVVKALEQQPLDTFIIDGEIVAFDHNQSSFARLQERMFVTKPTSKQITKTPITYQIFDLLYLNGRDLRSKPLLERKTTLKRALSFVQPLAYTDHATDVPSTYLSTCCNKGWEGLVAKDATSAYHAGKASAWIKIKCVAMQEFVIGGYTNPKGKRKGFGALLVGYYDASKISLIYAGKVGTGFSQKTIDRLMQQLKPLITDQPPFASDGYQRKGVHWVKPTLVAHIAFDSWTADGLLRQPRFCGLRTDKTPRDVIKEEKETQMNRSKTRSIKVGKQTVELSNEDKILFPADKITKGDIIAYYHTVAPVMLPHMKNRPVSMLRYPDGITGEGFYQKNIGDYYPDWIKSARIRKEGGFNQMLVCNDAATLVYLANQACLTPHLWLSRTDDLDRPDRMIFDLDPGDKTNFATVKATALKLNALIEPLGLVPFVMTTGSRGLHVTIPLKRTEPFETVRACARAIADRLVAQDPKNTTTEIRLNKRQGRLFIDTNRNAFAQTGVSPYAVRAKPKAPVATPLHWQELNDPKLTAQSYTIKTIPQRIAKIGDPWKLINRSARSLAKAKKVLGVD